MVGLISTRTSPYEIAQQAIHDAAYMCTRTHGDAPEVRATTQYTTPYLLITPYLSSPPYLLTCVPGLMEMRQR